MYKEIIYIIILVSPHLAQEVVDGSDNREKRCIFPAQPDHGTYATNVPNGKPGDLYEYLVVNVTCDQNSRLEGLKSVFCYNGWWAEPLPKCVSLPAPISLSVPADNGSSNSEKSGCTLPPLPLHGTYITNIPNGSPGSVHSYLNVNVTCNRGYIIEGTASIFCYSGWWTENMPKCIPSPQQYLDLDFTDDTSNRQQTRNKCILPQYSAHSTYTTNILGAKPGEAYDIVAINITCETGYVVNGPHLVFCTGGQWPTQIPQCVPRCHLVPHPSVAYRCLISIELSDSGGRFRDCDEYEPLGTLARPFCRPHYHSTTALTFMECRDGEWSNNFQRCTPECGTLTPKGSQLILNGTIAKLGEVPWHAAIYRKTTQPYTLICGGSLISANIIISAAHCFWDSLVGKLPASDYIVALGKLYRDYHSKLDKPQWANVESLRLPQRFRESATNFQDDIAVLELSKSIVFQAHIRPVCVDFDVSFERRQLQPGKKGKVAGWGLTTELGNPSQELRSVELPYVSIETCFEKVPHTFSPFITSDKICAGYNDAGTALCKGDSGGGLAFLAVDRSTPRYYLRGVASTAPTNDNACNANTYTTFTRLLKHENFITLYWQP